MLMTGVCREAASSKGLISRPELPVHLQLPNGIRAIISGTVIFFHSEGASQSLV